MYEMVIFHRCDRPNATEEDGKLSAIFFRGQTDPYNNMMMTDERDDDGVQEVAARWEKCQAVN